ncbi:cob(I)yrinic acid a,c-diamide adenosyltransferase [Magnetococcales bacterium HHB-1]
MKKNRDRGASVQGRIVVLTGEGKGKSSSAFGMMLRACGWQIPVCVIQFIKGDWKTGEERAAQNLPGIDWYALGDGFTWKSEDLERDKKTTRDIWQFAKDKMVSNDYGLVILDEINYVLGLGWLDSEEVASFIQQQKPSACHLILTGRDAPEAVISVADTVSQIDVVKHGFKQGMKACRGIEF